MTKRRISSWLAGMVGILISTSGSLAAFQTKGQITLSAVATVTSAGASGPVTLNIPQQVPLLAFFGKNIVIPIEITLSGSGAPGSTAHNAPLAVPGLAVSLFYNLFDSNDTYISGPFSVPVPLQLRPGSNNFVIGTAIIPVRDLQAIRPNGSVRFFFRLQQGDQPPFTVQNSTTTRVQFTDTMNFPVDQTGNLPVVVPDPYLTDGKTTLVFPPGALSGPGTLRVRQFDPITVPAGPGGLTPVVAYDFELQGTSLEREMQMTLTYPANADGTLIGSNGNPANLTPFWLQGGLNWSLLGPHRWNSTQHTVSLTSPHFSTFALFLAGANSAADLRPRQRVLTPNGDGVNDTIDFSGIGTLSVVHLFDMKGRRVRKLEFPNLVWDGRDDDGRIVESGLYLYQYTSQGERVSGLILIAK